MAVLSSFRNGYLVARPTSLAATPTWPTWVLDALRLGGSFPEVLDRWSGWPDLNRRPPRPKRGALPNCATARGDDSLADGAGGVRPQPSATVRKSEVAGALRPEDVGAGGRSRVPGHHPPCAEDRPAHQPGDDDADGHGGGLRQESGVPAAAAGPASAATEYREPPGARWAVAKPTTRTLQVRTGAGSVPSKGWASRRPRARSSMITATVRCPISDPSPRPTTNPMTASSSSHNPLLIMSEFEG